MNGARCPKCQNANLCDAGGEGGEGWKKCFACGWRGVPITGRPRREDEEVDLDEGEDATPDLSDTADAAELDAPVLVPVKPYTRRPHTMSPEARTKIAEAQRRRHAAAGHKVTTQEVHTMVADEPDNHAPPRRPTRAAEPVLDDPSLKPAELVFKIGRGAEAWSKFTTLWDIRYPDYEFSYSEEPKYGDGPITVALKPIEQEEAE